jgi:hypothetical protein
MRWELLQTPGAPPKTFSLDSDAARKLLSDAVAAADGQVVWRKDPLALKPSAELVKLVRLSQELSVKQSTDED